MAQSGFIWFYSFCSFAIKMTYTVYHGLDCNMISCIVDVSCIMYPVVGCKETMCDLAGKKGHLHGHIMDGQESSLSKVPP